MTARVLPSLHIPLRRVRNTITEVRADDLSFGRAESQRFFQDTLKLALNASLLDTLQAKTEGWAAALEKRFVDLLEPFRSFAWYHPDQLGSASQKAVLPLLGAGGYDHLEIADGGAAAREYLRSLDPMTPPAEREGIRAALLAYCGRDTEGMVEIVEGLERAVRGGAG